MNKKRFVIWWRRRRGGLEVKEAVYKYWAEGLRAISEHVHGKHKSISTSVWHKLHVNILHNGSASKNITLFRHLQKNPPNYFSKSPSVQHLPDITNICSFQVERNLGFKLGKMSFIQSIQHHTKNVLCLDVMSLWLFMQSGVMLWSCYVPRGALKKVFVQTNFCSTLSDMSVKRQRFHLGVLTQHAAAPPAAGRLLLWSWPLTSGCCRASGNCPIRFNKIPHHQMHQHIDFSPLIPRAPVCALTHAVYVLHLLLTVNPRTQLLR